MSIYQQKYCSSLCIYALLLKPLSQKSIISCEYELSHHLLMNNPHKFGIVKKTQPHFDGALVRCFCSGHCSVHLLKLVTVGIPSDFRCL